jgi:hypothetical protein
VAFEFIEKAGAPFYAFHDRDLAPEGARLAESNHNLDAVVEVLKEKQQHGHKIALSHRLPVHPSAFGAWSGEHSECRCICLCCCAGEEGYRSGS